MAVLNRVVLNRSPEAFLKHMGRELKKLLQLPQGRKTKTTLSSLTLDQLFELIEGFRFIDDPPGREVLRSPWTVLELGGGDCDDIAMFVAYWCVCRGCKWSWSLWGINGEIKHIATRVKTKTDDVFIDFHGDVDNWKPLFIDFWRR